MKEHLEGRQSILSALKARKRKIELLMVSFNAHKEKTEEAIALAGEQNIPVKTVTPEELDAASKGKTHGGLIAICSHKPTTQFPELLDSIKSVGHNSFLLLLEGVEDEQNLGFIIRSAGAFGVNAMLLKKHIWNFDELTLSRTSAGAYEQMPLVKIEKEAESLNQLKKAGLKIFGAIAGVKKTLYDIDFTVPCVIALGGEKRGLSAVVRENCDSFFTIPMPQHNDAVEKPSLSLSHSAAIIMAEVMRQRLNKTTG
ncbi:MAG: RNA methyltransferase [Planctomycetes bacterium]|nr:RNA methyltransferase [Planctomycetota bacterium]